MDENLEKALDYNRMQDKKRKEFLKKYNILDDKKEEIKTKIRNLEFEYIKEFAKYKGDGIMKIGNRHLRISSRQVNWKNIDGCTSGIEYQFKIVNKKTGEQARKTYLSYWHWVKEEDIL